MAIKAIETVYNGYRFRSRLEARWAVFFDALGLKYEYEPQGFDLDGLRYLPDFLISDVACASPSGQCWIEIKPHRAELFEEKKARRLAGLGDRPVYIFEGECWVPVYDGKMTDGARGIRFDNDGKVSVNHVWFEERGRFGIEQGGLILRYSGSLESTTSERLIRAFTAARQARFEHGERPGW